VKKFVSSFALGGPPSSVPPLATPLTIVLLVMQHTAVVFMKSHVTEITSTIVLPVSQVSKDDYHLKNKATKTT